MPTLIAQALPTPSFWDKALDQVPGLAVTGAVLMFVVWKFLSHLTKNGEARDQTMREISASCHAVQAELVVRVEALGARTHIALDRTYEALGRADSLADEIRGIRADHERYHREDMEAHQQTRHTQRDLAHAAGLKALAEQLKHQVTGLPPGAIVVEAQGTRPEPPPEDAP